MRVQPLDAGRVRFSYDFVYPRGGIQHVEWDGRFDAVIANGPVEHFAQPADAAAGRDDAIYRHLFATVHRLLDPTSSVAPSE